MEQMIYTRGHRKDILDRGEYNGFNYLIVSYGTHPCAYVEIPKDNILFGKHYAKYNLDDKIKCHGGITFTEYGCETFFNTNPELWYLGWDYTHYSDYSGYMEDTMDIRFAKQWTTEEILEEVKNVINQIKDIPEDFQFEENAF